MEIKNFNVSFKEKDLVNCVYLDGEVEIPVYGNAYKKIYLYRNEESGEVEARNLYFQLENILGFRESKGSWIGAELKKDNWCVMGYVEPNSHKIFEYAVDSTYQKMRQWWTEIEGYKQIISQVVLEHELKIVEEIKEKIALRQ